MLLLAAVPVMPFGSTQVVRQFAAVELQFIMQFVTVDVTVVVCGGVGVGFCASAAATAPSSANKTNKSGHKIVSISAALRMRASATAIKGALIIAQRRR